MKIAKIIHVISKMVLPYVVQGRNEQMWNTKIEPHRPVLFCEPRNSEIISLNVQSIKHKYCALLMTFPLIVWLVHFFRPCLEWWSILPHTYKFFLILVVLAVLLVGFLFIQSFVKSLASDKDNASGARYVPNPVYDYKLPKSYSTLHLFKSGAVCSDSKICSEIGK